MRAWDRILLILASLISLTVCVWLIVFLWGFVPLSYLTNLFAFIMAKWQIKVLATAVLCVLMALFIRVMIIRIRRKTAGLKLTDEVAVGGDKAVSISVAALGELCTQVAKEESGIKEASCAISRVDGMLQIAMKVQCSGADPVPYVANKLKSDLAQMLKDTCGVENAAVNVLVEHISGHAKIQNSEDKPAAEQQPPMIAPVDNSANNAEE
ncbi:MAG: alkaline shock response membrane anchor protein AmaP [Clostridia bacterium]|nr:alkaline shock response membrane anchor protein AmaP [Clostridia bacterium]